MPGIFDKQRLTATQLRTVADRRLDDARYLCDSGRNARANGAMYLAGFVLELMLKAKLLEKHPVLSNGVRPERGSAALRRAWELCYRSHDLSLLLAALPEVARHVMDADQRGHAGLYSMLQSACGEWTIYARYSSRSATIPDARRFIQRIESVRPWLK